VYRDGRQHGCRTARRWRQRQTIGVAQFAHSDPPGLGRVFRTASDIEVQAREIIRMNARLQEMMAADTGQSVDRLGHEINRDYWMSAAEAKDYGVIDLIVGQTAATVAADRAEAAVKDTPLATTGSANGTC
jgi:Clp protease